MNVASSLQRLPSLYWAKAQQSLTELFSTKFLDADGQTPLCSSALGACGAYESSVSFENFVGIQPRLSALRVIRSSLSPMSTLYLLAPTLT